MATAKTKITRTAQISTNDVTVEDINTNATKVGAPATARVSTGSGSPTSNPDEYLPYTVTYSWTEEIA